MTIPVDSPPVSPGKAWVTLLTNSEYVASRSNLLLDERVE